VCVCVHFDRCNLNRGAAKGSEPLIAFTPQITFVPDNAA